MLAPTEVLAQQHHRSIVQMLGAGGGRAGGPVLRSAGAAAFDPVGRKQVKVALLTGSQNAKDRRDEPARRGLRRGRHRDRHARGDPGPRPVRRPRPGRDRRAAPLRRRAARRAARQGRGPAARAGHDRDADPAHGGHDGVRRPGDLDPVRAAGRPLADRHARGGGARAPLALHAGLGADPRGGRRRAPGLRGLPADRRGARRRRGLRRRLRAGLRTRAAAAAAGRGGRRGEAGRGPAQGAARRRCCTAAWRRTTRTP